MAISKILIANRGEIAVRIIRAARELGLKTVQAYSEADKNSLAVEMADEAILIGPAPAQKSYLNGTALIKAAQKTGADALHPGYGFLSENADFADQVAQSGLTFIGPDGHIIRKMGDKAGARQAAQNADIPIVPGSDGLIQDMNAAVAGATDIGFPVMIKATAGGGGRGIRIAHDENMLRSYAAQAAAEAKAAFGDAGLYLEKFIPKARHIEVQILGDGQNVIHCFERECSVQRRRQKVWEEAPSIALDAHSRQQLCQAAVKLATSVHYKGAGTVEFLFDDQSQEFYFIEMNTRIQVEHPVTEMVTGIDLVSEMIKIADGQALSYQQDDIQLNGHAIEARITAEDPNKNFMPNPGKVTELRIPGGPDVRFDHALFHGSTIPAFYDSLIGKLIVWGVDRNTAIRRLNGAISELTVGGIATSTPLFTWLCESREIHAADIHTGWLQEWLEQRSATLTAKET